MWAKKDVVENTPGSATNSVQPDIVGAPTSQDTPELEAAAILSLEPVNRMESLPSVAYITVLVLRLLVGPFIGAAVACGFLRMVCGVHDRVVLMVAMLQSAGPPMINLAVMAGLNESAEKETAKLLLVTYAFSIVSWTTSIAFFLRLLH